MKPHSLVVVVTGASAAVVITAYLAELRPQLAARLTVLMTHNAERFVRPTTVEWFADEVLTSDCPTLNPLEVALRAGSIVVLPATAHVLAATALALPSTPALTALVASPRPCLWFPHMNQVMWRKPAVQRHVAALRASGETVVEPVSCETYEMWRRAPGNGVSMQDPEEAAATICAWLGSTHPEMLKRQSSMQAQTPDGHA